MIIEVWRPKWLDETTVYLPADPEWPNNCNYTTLYEIDEGDWRYAKRFLATDSGRMGKGMQDWWIVPWDKLEPLLDEVKL